MTVLSSLIFYSSRGGGGERDLSPGVDDSSGASGVSCRVVEIFVRNGLLPLAFAACVGAALLSCLFAWLFFLPILLAWARGLAVRFGAVVSHHARLSSSGPPTPSLEGAIFYP